jgi:hypothetical protein
MRRQQVCRCGGLAGDANGIVEFFCPVHYPIPHASFTRTSLSYLLFSMRCLAKAVHKKRTVDEKVLDAYLLYGTKTLTRLKACTLRVGFTCGSSSR